MKILILATLLGASDYFGWRAADNELQFSTSASFPYAWLSYQGLNMRNEGTVPWSLMRDDVWILAEQYTGQLEPACWRVPPCEVK